MRIHDVNNSVLKELVQMNRQVIVKELSVRK